MDWRQSGIVLALAAHALADEPPPVYLYHLGRTGSSLGMMRVSFGVCTDRDGFVYVAELGGNRIQKWNLDRECVLRWGSRGSDPGLFQEPVDVVPDSAGRIWVSDRANHRLQCFTRDGTFLAAFSGPGDAPGEFASPSGLASRDGFLYVADTYNHRVQKLTIRGTTLEPVLVCGEFGTGHGQLIQPQDVDVAPNGEIYVTDFGNNRVQVFGPDGDFRAHFGENYHRGRMTQPYGLCLDALGCLYVSEPVTGRILKFGPNKAFLFAWGSTANDKVERMNRPLHLWMDAAGYLYVADHDDQGYSDRIVVWCPANVSPVHERSWSEFKRGFR